MKRDNQSVNDDDLKPTKQVTRADILAYKADINNFDATQKAMLEKFGISRDRLRKLIGALGTEERNKFEREWRARRQAALGGDATSQVLAALHRKALNGDTHAMKLWLRVAGYLEADVKVESKRQVLVVGIEAKRLEVEERPPIEGKVKEIERHQNPDKV